MLRIHHFRVALRTSLATVLLIMLIAVWADGAPVGARDVRRISEDVARSPSYNLRVVEKLIADLRRALSRSQTAAQRLYYPVGQPKDDYIRFRDLRELCRGLTSHAVDAFERKDFARAEKALNLAISTMLVIAEAPPPPNTLYLDGNVPGDLSACRPVNELYASLFLFTTAVKKIVEGAPALAAPLQSVWINAFTAQLIFADSQKRKHLQQLLSDGKYREYAQECARMRAEMRDALYKLKDEVGSAFKRIKR